MIDDCCCGSAGHVLVLDDDCCDDYEQLSVRYFGFSARNLTFYSVPGCVVVAVDVSAGDRRFVEHCDSRFADCYGSDFGDSVAGFDCS